MNENIKNNTFFINNVCRVCLATTKQLHPMSDEHMKLYINMVDEMVFTEYNMNNCITCQWMLQKFYKFKQQCWLANNLLNESCSDSKLLQPLQSSGAHLTHTNTLTHTYNPTRHSHHTQHTTHTHERKHMDTSHIYTQNSDAIFTSALQKEIHDDMVNDGCVTNDTFTNDDDNTNDNVDEDELPLVMMSNKNKTIKKKRTKKKKAKEKMDPEDATLESMAEMDPGGTREGESKSVKGVAREGFSSRMVQETEEYVVIKLSREQVREEMSARSKTDSYINSLYKCDKCVRGFNFQDVLDTHLEKHSSKNGPFQCDMCEQYCRSAVSLRGHIKSHTTRYRCKLCGAVRASRQHLVEHHAGHAGAAPRYRCVQCTFTTSKRTVMQRHARGHAPREPLACRACGKLFRTIHCLRLHAARHDNSSRYRCTQCPATFMYHSVLRKHTQRVHETRELYCVECDVHFKCDESLRVHFKKAKRHRDSSTPQHSCDKCPASFYSAGALATHLTHAHDASKQHACSVCHHAYTTRDAVRAHTWRVHARGDSRHTCLQCGASFARASALKAHVLSHSHAAPRDVTPPAAGLLCAGATTCKKQDLPHYGNKMEV